MNLLFVGDIVGKGGRRAAAELIPRLRAEHNCQLCAANAENAANGCGLSSSCVKELSPHIDVLTTGDHIWDQKNFEREILSHKNVLRPANMSRLQPGSGFTVITNPGGGQAAFISLVGRIFMKESARCPFETAEEILKALPPGVKNIFVDFHAEATSEKAAMAWFLDGKVTAVLGTHTHVQTADTKILPGGTAFISDVGMTGAERSVLGRDVDAVVRKFRTGMPEKLTVVETGIRLDAVVVSYDHNTGRATGIRGLSVMEGPAAR